MEQETKRKQIIKKIASIFLIVMLILTFFSNTIMNYSLPEVATEVVTGGTVSNKVRGQGTVETNSNYEVMVSGTRVIKEVKVEVGDTVEKGQVLFTFEEGENTELAEAQDLLDQMELDYAKSMLKMAPDYTSENMDIKAAKKDLEDAIDAKEKAQKNNKELKKAKKEAEQAQTAVDTQQDKVDGIQEKVDAYGEVGDYDAAQAQVETTKKELSSMKTQLSDLEEDLADAQAVGEDTKELKRAIRDIKLEISNKESDLKTQEQLANSLKTTSASYKQLKEELETETKTLESLQKNLKEKNAKVEKLSAALSLKDAKAAVEEKQKTLTQLLLALKEQKEQDGLSQQADNLDMQDAQKKIEKQRQLVEKLENSNDLKEIKATDAGTVSQIDYKAGDSVTADAPIAKIQLSDSGYIVKITITKNKSKLIKVGDEAIVENVWDEDLTAEVKSIKADPENPNQNVIVAFEVKGNVDVGETLSLSVGDKSNRYDTVVPNSAVKEDSNGKFVLIVTVKGTPLGNRYKVKRVDVEVLASDDTSSGVSGGLYEYDNVITNASQPLEEGMQVRLVE
ncbi:MAG: HlyD family efflux transporter periplasmic adaptor subunit [Lachnospiraceae bacterium]|nr:HlyD family efflux transporter periplasmic adaptor subunit [Lachnospiraceae bacterium]